MGYLTFYMFRPHIDTQPSDYSDTLAVETVLPESVICDSAAIDVPAEPKQPKTYKSRAGKKAESIKRQEEAAAAAKLDEEMKKAQKMSYSEK